MREQETRRDSQVSEDELRNVHVLLLMHLNRDSPSVVVDRDDVGLSIDGDLELVHGGVVDLRRKRRTRKGQLSSTPFSLPPSLSFFEAQDPPCYQQR